MSTSKVHLAVQVTGIAKALRELERVPPASEVLRLIERKRLDAEQPAAPDAARGAQ